MLDRDDLLASVMARAKEMPPFEEAEQAIELLSGAGIGTGALSNSSTRSLASLVEASGLQLSPLVGSDSVRAFKPRPRIYAAAISAVEVDPEGTAIVSAHSWDALGAKRAGMRAAWISRDEGLPLQVDEPFDFTANDLAEAAGLIVASTEHPARAAES